MTNVGRTNLNGKTGQLAAADNDQGQGRQDENEKKGVSRLTVLVTLVSYTAYVIILLLSPNVEITRRLLAGALFFFTAPFCIGVGGSIGNWINPEFVIASDAWELLKMRLFWWVGPRFIGAMVAAVFATLIGAPDILNR